MTKYTVTIEFEANGEPGLNEVSVEAGGIHANQHWLIFNADNRELATNVIAMFPTDRVISVVKAES